ncbi:Cas10/Cmr2 second palm domain-containing protein [Phytoactinopolyspora limicola]|uniref:Cas10/Cmr2 second palm domain-containing protein n=1 Tax=Phytoactinopolyspora limicola TaxID=2715536 RepID=UPI00140CDDAE|nr:hypothetical protein [Phytoactinopolyspora limicola]
MTLYLRAGVARIQSYVSRTPKLSLLRGASTALTHQQLMAAAASAGFQAHPSAVNVDGVIDVVSDRQGSGEAEASRLAVALRKRIPGAEMHVSWVYADDDDLALGELAALQAQGPGLASVIGDSGRIETLPSPNELPTARLCDMCRLDSATATISVKDAEENRVLSVCPDCSMRNKVSGGTGRTFDELAALDKRSGNHLATIYIDANRLGEVFQTSTANGDFRVIARLSRDVAESVTAALDAGRIAAREHLGCAEDPVIAHVTGGDDVLVSVPARAAWPFTQAYVRTATTDMRQALSTHLNDVQTSSSGSVSAGIVFADTHYPFSATSQLAYDVLRHAKNVVQGEQASISWVHVTVDGRRVPPTRAVLRESSLDSTDELRTALNDFARLGASTRRNLALRYKPGDPNHWETWEQECERLGLEPERFKTLSHPPNPGVFTPVEAELLARSWWHD